MLIAFPPQDAIAGTLYYGRNDDEQNHREGASSCSTCKRSSSARTECLGIELVRHHPGLRSYRHAMVLTMSKAFNEPMAMVVMTTTTGRSDRPHCHLAGRRLLTPV